MATGVEEEFHKYYNELVFGQIAMITTQCQVLSCIQFNRLVKLTSL